jgi:ribosomal protein L23
MARKKRTAASSSDTQDSAIKADGTVNKTKAVLAYLKVHPRAKNTKIAEDLTQQYGIEFKATNVGATKHQLKKRGALKGKRGPGRPAAASADKVDVADLVAAKKLAERFGGVEKARKMLDVLAQLGS